MSESLSAPSATLPNPPSKSVNYIPTLDGIRAIAFLIVFGGHSELIHLIPGGFGVTIFFFLSGYLITTLLRLEVARTSDVSLKSFYLRRFFRINPPMYFTLAVVALLTRLHLLRGTFSLAGLSSVLFYYYNYLALLSHRDLFPNGVSVIWSLSIEEHFYFIFPLVFVLFFRRSVHAKTQVRFLLVACTSALIWRVYVTLSGHFVAATPTAWTYSATDCRFDDILWGCILAIRENPYFRRDTAGESVLQRHQGSLAFVGLVMLIVTFVVPSFFFRETFRYSLQAIALYPIFFYCIANEKSLLSRTLELAPLKFLGRLSYSMYLIHAVLLRSFLPILTLGLLPRVAAVFCLTLAYGLFVRHFIEQPIHAKRIGVVKVKMARVAV